MTRVAPIVMLLALADAALAEDLQAVMRRDSGANAVWYCEPQADSLGLWHLRCENPNRLPEDDPVLAAAGLAAPRWWLVPTYSLPVDVEYARRLVRAVLCAGAPCRVALALDGRRNPRSSPDDQPPAWSQGAAHMEGIEQRRDRGR